MNVLIVGAGAIGAFYGALLAKAGAGVSVTCRSDYDYVKRHGFLIDSDMLGSWSFIPRQVLRHSSDLQGTADFVILCTKVLPELDRVALIRDAVTAQTAIVFIQNGIAIEQEIQNAFPDHDIISGLAFICCNRVHPGHIHHLAYGRLTLGDVSGTLSEKTLQLSVAFNRAGIECIASENIITDRWQKCIWNAPFNPLSVLSGGLPTLDILTTQEALVRHIMQDVFNIAKASGHTLPNSIIDDNIASTYAMQPYKTSMLLDYELGQTMEIEAIVGNALRAALEVKVDCPYLATVYALMKLRELKLR